MAEKESVHIDSFVSFIDHDGCRTFAEMLGEHVIEKVYPQIPCMLAVDHSLTGGVYQKLITLASPEKGNPRGSEQSYRCTPHPHIVGCHCL